MARIRPEQRCPCGSGRIYKRCCQRLHAGAPAPTAEALMRSRYTAYAAGLADYIVDTTHPGGPRWEADRARWLADIARFSEGATFDRLWVREAREEGDRATVTFEAHLRQGLREIPMVETSLFMRENGRWMYHSAVEPQGHIEP